MPQTAPGDAAPPDAEEIARTLLTLIREELGDESIEEDDDFYAVGGDSLIAVRVVARAGELGIGIRLLDLLTHPSAGELAESYAADPTRADAPPLPPEPLAADAGGGPGEPGEPVPRPASDLQIGLVYQCEMSDDPSLYNDLIGVRVRGPFDEDRFRAALTALLARHPALRSSFDLAADPEPVQLVHPALPLPLDIDRPAPPGPDADAACHTAAARWRARQLATAFDWETPPLFRCHVAAPTDTADPADPADPADATAAPRDGGGFRLTVAMHHALMDGWSFATVVTDLVRLYDAALGGADGADLATALPAPPPGGHELFVAAEREAAASAEAAAFWQQHAEGPHLLPDRDRSAAPGDASARLSLPFEDELLAGLRSAAAEAGAPLKSLLLAVHAWALAHWSGTPGGMATGVVLSGRPEQPDTDLTVGLFLNTVPFRLPAHGTWAELARTARDTETAAVPHRRYPLARIEEKLGRPPFDVAFNFTDFRVYRNLEALRAVRVDEWWHADKASHPVSCDYTLDFPGFGTGLLVTHDAAAVPEDRARALLQLVEAGLRSAARAPHGQAPDPAGGPR